MIDMHVILRADQYIRLQELGGPSMAEHVRRAVDAYLSRMENGRYDSRRHIEVLEALADDLRGKLKMCENEIIAIHGRNTE